MRHLVFFLLTTVCNIGTLESRVVFPEDRARLAFQDDYVEFRCTVDISAYARKYPELWWNDVNNGWTVVASAFRYSSPTDQTTTKYGFQVTEGSNSTHLRAAVKAQCQNSGYYTCDKKSEQPKPSQRMLLLVIPSVPKPRLSVYYYYCDEVHDPRCESCWRTSSKVVKYNEPSTISCTAKIPFPFRYEVGFEWYYKIDNKPQDCWQRIRSNVSAQWVNDTPYFYGYQTTYCPPLTEKTSTLVFSPPTESDEYAVKCEVHFRVGNLVQISQATVNFCALGRMVGPPDPSSTGYIARTSDPNIRPPKPTGSGNKDKIKDGNSTHLVTKRHVLENETVKILCYQAFTMFGTLRLLVKSPKATNGWKTLAMAGNTHSYKNLAWGADGFSVSPSSNCSYLYVETKARCNLTGKYKCSLEADGVYEHGKVATIEVIKVVSPPTVTLRDIGCDNFIDQRCNTCKKDGYIVRKHTKPSNITCAARTPILDGTEVTFEWYYRIEGKACWNRLMRNISLHRGWVISPPFKPGQCEKLQPIESDLSFSPLEDETRVELKCIVNARHRRDMHQTVQATVKICFLDRRKRLRPTIYAIPKKVFENDPAQFQCFMEGPADRTSRIDLSVSPKGNELSRSVASVQIDKKSYSPLAKNSGFNLLAVNYSYLAAEIKRVQCKDTNNYLCEYKMDGQPTAKSALLRFEVIRRLSSPALMFLSTTLCDGGTSSLCTHCNSRVPIEALPSSGLVKIECSSDVPSAEGLTLSFKWYYREQYGAWRSGNQYQSHMEQDWFPVISKPGTCAPRKRVSSTLYLPRTKTAFVEIQCRIEFRLENVLDSLTKSIEFCVLDPVSIDPILPWAFKGVGTKAGNIGMIVGIVVSVMAVFAGVVLVISYTRRRGQNTKDGDEETHGPDDSDPNQSESRQRSAEEDVTPSVSRRSRTAKIVTPSGSRRSRTAKNVTPSGFRKRTEKDVTSTFSSKSRPSKRSTYF